MTNDRSQAGTNSLFRGSSAESHAAGFLKDNFFSLGKLDPDIGMDFTGHLHDPKFSNVEFCFQIKSSIDQDVDYISIDRKTIERWVNGLQRKSVFIFYVYNESIFQQRYQYLILYNWIQSHPYWRIHLNTHKTLSFNSKEFADIGNNAEHFRAAIILECDRVDNKSSYVFSTLSLSALPVDDIDMFGFMGSLFKLQVPQHVFEELESTQHPESNIHKRSILRDTLMSRCANNVDDKDRPYLNDWINNLLLQSNGEDIKHDIFHFHSFIHALQSHARHEDFKLPKFTWKGISSWRTLTQIFSKSMGLLAYVLENPHKYDYDQIRSASLLISTLANCDDSVIEGRAKTVLLNASRNFAKCRVKDINTYNLIRQIFFALSEAFGQERVGGKRINPVKQCVDFIRSYKEEYPLAEKWLHDSYYPHLKGDGIIIVMEKKITMPKQRDIHTLPITEYLYEYLSKYRSPRSSTS